MDKYLKINENLKKQLKVKAAQDGTSIKALAENYIQQGLKKKEVKEMIVVKNTKLFQDLKKNPQWDTLFSDDKGTLKDSQIPILYGGLDHIEVTKNRICFYDIGTSINEKICDNSFVVKKQ